MGEIEVEREILGNFLLKLSVGGVDARVRIVLTEHADRSTKRYRSSGIRRNRVGPGRGLSRSAKASEGERSGASHAKLLRAIRGDRAHLGKHVLARIVDTIISPHHRLAGVEEIPGKSQPGLKLSCLIMQCTV